MKTYQFDGFKSALIHPEIASNLMMSLIVIVLVFILRPISTRFIQVMAFENAERKRLWMIRSRNALAFLALAVLIVIWGSELKTLALSIVALTAAMTIAFKELILCFIGGMLKIGSRIFTIGDRIEVGAYRGDVIDHSFLTTTLFEIGPGKEIHQYTGRSIVIPNSLFLTQGVVNETATHRYVLHVFTVPLRSRDDWQRYETALIEAAREECAEFIEEARTYFNDMSHSRGLEPPYVEPRVFIGFPKAGELSFSVRIPTPAKRKGRVEQAIIRRFLARIATTPVPAPTEGGI